MILIKKEHIREFCNEHEITVSQAELKNGKCGEYNPDKGLYIWWLYDINWLINSHSTLYKNAEIYQSKNQRILERLGYETI